MRDPERVGVPGQGGVVGHDLGRGAAQRWIERWDAQQGGHLPHREDRFTALIDALEVGGGRPDPLVLDLGCGPGSLAVRMLDRIPVATVIAIDSDPLLLALGRAAYQDRAGLRFVDLDLRAPGWATSLGLDRPADAAVSTTALHWLRAPELRVMYAEVASVLRPGGLLLNGDHLAEDETAFPVSSRLCRELTGREEARHVAPGAAESWKGWWEAAVADPGLAGPATERARRRLSEDHHGAESLLLTEHVRALREAGFGEVGTIWQHGDNRILCAVRSG